jgi:lysophospholipase L1-like esterase
LSLAGCTVEAFEWSGANSHLGRIRAAVSLANRLRDQASRMPGARPTQQRLLAAYDSGEHLHANEAGYQAMANAINLNLFS